MASGGYTVTYAAIYSSYGIEAKKFHDIAAGSETYARQAQSFEHELRAMDIRLRASVRAGQLINQGRKDGTIAKQGGTGKNQSQTSKATMSAKTLDDLGITPDQGAQWVQLAGIPEEELEESLPANTGERRIV